MTAAEILSSLEMGLIYGIVALGIYLTFRIIDFPDLTCDGSFVSGAAASAVLLKAGIHPLLALLFALFLGAVAGFITGILYVYCRLTNLLSGILTAFMLYSLNLKLMGGAPNIPLFHASTILAQYPVLTLITIACIIWSLCSYLLTTDFGLALRSIGQNKKLARMYGVRISLLTMYGLILSNSLIGLGGALFCQYQKFADISQGFGTIVIGLAAVMIGEKILPFRSMWIGPLACILGSIVYRFIVACALHSEWLGLESSDLNLITGLIIVFVMLFSSFSPKRRKSIC
ncbi:MAG: hypothetical protein JSS34_07095 [Proteobacteria bacterium]|nr:hypothetical protein [Pseudomonadota bacterium]